jgi:PAS domain S-box-containing protein
MKVLYVEDDARDADLARREFARLSTHFGLELASGLGEARERLGDGTAHDLVLTDLKLPDGSGLELLAEIRARALPVAAVVLTGSESAEIAVAAFKAGADDFVLKTNGYLARLPGVLVAALDRFRAEGARQERPLRVLYAEDSAIDADLTRQHLARHAPNIRLEVVQGVPELLQRLPRAAGEPPPCDVLLLDYRLAGADALEALTMLREERHLYLPVVLVTGQGDGEVAARAFRCGAANYVIKRPGYLSELPAVLESAHDRAQLVRNIAERTSTEESLRQSEQYYHELLSAVPGAVYSFRVDAQGRRSFPFMSEGIGDLAGLSAGEVMADAEAAFQRVPDEAMPALEQSIGASLQQLSPWMHEFPIRTASGEEKWLRGQSLPRRETDGATVWHGVFIDITGRKRAEEALRRSGANLHSIAENATAGITMFQEGRRVFANRRAAEMLGYTVEEFLPLALGEVIHPDSLALVLDRHRRRAAGEDVPTRYEFTALAKDGRAIPVEGNYAVTMWNGRPAIMAFVTDITKRKHAEESLLRFRVALDNSADMILLVDRSTMRYVDVNETACRLLGWSREELCGMGPQDVLLESREKIERYYDDLIANPSRAQSMRIEYRCKDGSVLPFESTRRVQTSGNGHLIVAVSRDIRERLAIEQNLRESEERFRNLTELSSDWYWEQDENYRFIDMTRVPTGSSSLRAGGYTGKARWEIYAESLAPEQWAAHRRQVEAHETFRDLEFERPSEDGQMRWVSVSGLPIFDKDGRFRGYRGIGKDITERRLAADDLRRFRAAIDASADLVLLIDPATMRYIDVNETTCRTLGYSRAEMLAMGPHHIFSVPREAMAGIYSRLIAGDLRETAAEGWYRRKDGSRLLVESIRRAVPSGKGHVIVAVARDITERNTTENALRLLSTGMTQLSGEAFFNEVACRMAEYLEVEIGFVSRLQAPANTRIRTLGLCVDRQVMPPLEFDLAGTPCEAVIGKQPAVLPERARQLYPAFRMAADLGVEGYAAVPLFDTHGKPIGAVGVMSRAPLREGAARIEALLQLFAVRAAAESERQSAETKFKDLFEFSADACLIVDQEGIITAMNRGAILLLGYSPEELVGLPVDVLVPERSRRGHTGLRRSFHAAATSRSMGSGRTELHACRKDGTMFPVDIDLHPLQTDEGAVVVATVRDITERKQTEAARALLEAQLRQSQKMEAVGTLAGGIAHDFNNIIGAILGNAALALADVGTDHRALESIVEIDKAGRRARDLVQQILAFSRKQALSRSIIALGPVVEDAVKLLQATLPAGVQLRAVCAAGTPSALADPTQIHQVLVNLCTNAWHAMEGRSGNIDVRLDDCFVDAEWAVAHPDLRPGRYARISVRDTGEGMNAATMDRIFEPFFTTKAIDEGTGLGLSVVHGILQGHEGAIVVDSAPGIGTTFHLYFPATDAQAPADSSAAAVSAPLRGQGQHVLYLDDDEALVSLVSRMLERQGYRVSGHTLAQAALDAVRADPGGFDLVLSDYNMPVMSGLDVARELSRIRPDLPVAVISGYITDELREEAPRSGVRHLIYKPDTADELCEVVWRLTRPAD